MRKPSRDWIRALFADAVPAEVAFRVDAGRVRNLSFGHLERCLVMARALRGQGVRCRFLMAGSEGAARVEQAGFSVQVLAPEPGRPLWAEVAAHLAESGCRALVADLPYADMDHDGLAALAAGGVYTVYVDDDRFAIPGVHAYLNSSVLAPARVNPGDHPGTRCFLGPEWLVLDELFFTHAAASRRGESVVLTFGGSDPTDLTGRVVDALARSGAAEREIVVVLGPGHPGTIELPETGRFRVERSPEDLIGLLSRSGGAVCSGGRTMYELWALGKPFLPIATAPHEARAVAAFQAQGLISLGMEAWDPEIFLNQFEQLQRAMEVSS